MCGGGGGQTHRPHMSGTEQSHTLTVTNREEDRPVVLISGEVHLSCSVLLQRSGQGHRIRVKGQQQAGVCVWGGGGAERSSHNTVPLVDSDYRRVCIISWKVNKT